MPDAKTIVPRYILSRSVYFLEQFEGQVKGARGRPFSSYEGRQALERIKALKKEYPEDPAVDELIARARVALRASKGGGVDITPEMLAYRELEEKIVAELGGLADEAWQAIQAEAEADGRFEAAPLPAPDPWEVGPDALVGKRIILEDFRWPDNQFPSDDGEYVHVGSSEQGFYYVDIGTRGYRAAYAALKRFRRGVSDDVAGPWTVIGTVRRASLKVPDAAVEPKTPAYMGWVVDVEAIYLPGKVLAQAAKAQDERGYYLGEDRVEALKEAAYTVHEVPANVEPVDIVNIFAATVKEKNWDLFCSCLDPSWFDTPVRIDRLRYYWDNNLTRYRTLYVHVEATEVREVIVIQGERIDELEAFFLTQSDVEMLLGRAKPLVEQATVPVKRYDERGRQVGSPNWIYLRRKEGGEWRVYSGFPL